MRSLVAGFDKIFMLLVGLVGALVVVCQQGIRRLWLIHPIGFVPLRNSAMQLGTGAFQQAVINRLADQVVLELVF